LSITGADPRAAGVHHLLCAVHLDLCHHAQALGRAQAWFSVLLSLGVALLLSALVRLVMGLAA